ncbi:MAG TPA: hypothetical protein VMD30_00650, partial [Tepidisphaeraceae bacterium]|nr:hypothetical protein [Tepidisphaeraceae bacterium]
MNILTALCSTPTAPFAEWHVVQWVEEFVKARPALRLERDPYENLLISLRGRGKKFPRWVFTAHMDHPGMVAQRMTANHKLLAAFYGSVNKEYLPGAAVKFFDFDDEIPGAIARVVSVDPQRPIYPATVEVKVKHPV